MRFETNENGAGVAIYLMDGHERIGSIVVRKQEWLPSDYSDPHTPCWQVASVEVAPGRRRQGLATRLYLEAGRQAARHGMGLCSDVPGSLAKEAEAFWNKQVARDAAYWEVPGPPEREGHNYDYGRFVMKPEPQENPPMLDGIFEKVVSRAHLVFPWIKAVKLRYCAHADRDHKKAWRQFAHTGCQDGAVCFARAAQDDLTADEMTGMVAHELGHVVGDTLRFPEHAKAKRSAGKTSQAVQDEADRIAKEFFGIEIRYNERTLQEARLI